MNDKLKPCPFCGGRAIVNVSVNGVRVICKECDCQTISLIDGNYSTGRGGSAVSSVIEKWNRRENTDIKYIKKLEGALDKACIFLSRIVDDPESIMSTWHIDEWREWCMDDDD